MTIISTPLAPHPQFGVRTLALDFAAGAGVITGDWLDADGDPVDSGNSIVHLTVSAEALTESQRATLAAAITASTA